MPAKALNKVKKARLKALARGGDMVAEASANHDEFRTSNVLVTSAAPSAQGTTNVHAALAGNAAVAFPGPITNPDFPRNVRAVFAALYDGGDIVVVGTDQFGAAQTETIVANAGNTVNGVKVWKTITSLTRTAVGATANTVSIGTGNLLGSPVKVGSGQASSVLLAVSGVMEAVTYDGTLNAFTPTSTPNASRTYILMMNV